jgi:prepilin-type N-terminal cleavage/methylation domain-containing protein
MLLFPHIYPNKSNKLDSGALGRLETKGQRQLTAAYGSLFLAGFTLMELLIAISIFSVVSIAIYSTFNSGASVLRRIKNIDFVQQKILLKTERFSRQLREMPVSRKPLFLGVGSKISFAGSSDYFPCRITYYLDPASSSLMYVTDKLDTIITSEGKVDAELKAKPEVFLAKVKEVKFFYLYLDLNKNEYIWTDQWQQDYLPVAVKFTITSQNQEYASTIFLPGV